MADPRYTLQPTRDYQVPGGPIAKDLGEVDVTKLADYKRGSGEDKGFGDRR